MSEWKVPLFGLNFGQEEITAVGDVLKDQWLTMGPRTEMFEKVFSKYLGNGANSIAVASGTAAIHLALLAVGVGPGDEVIISALSFVAALNAVVLVGAKPVLADCESMTDWNVSAKDIERKITNRTRAAVIVHYSGYPCNTNVAEILGRRGIVFIEDAAHAIGASIDGFKCGTLGDIGCFSFFSNKNITTGEGGMITTPHEDIYRACRLLRSHGMTSMTIDRHRGKGLSYDVLFPGFNYRIDEIRSAIGIVQLAKLDANNHRRAELDAAYRKILAGNSRVSVPFGFNKKGRTCSCHIFPVLLPVDTDRNEVACRMRNAGIQTSLHYPAYRNFSGYTGMIHQATPVADDICSRVLTLPLFPAMDEEMIHYICDVLKRSL